MKVYFYKLKGRYYAVTEHGYRLFPTNGADQFNADYVYQYLNYIIENRGETGEKVETVRVYRPGAHQQLCAAILRARVMGDPAADRYTTTAWHGINPYIY